MLRYIPKEDRKPQTKKERIKRIKTPLSFEKTLELIEEETQNKCYAPIQKRLNVYLNEYKRKKNKRKFMQKINREVKIARETVDSLEYQYNHTYVDMPQYENSLYRWSRYSKNIEKIFKLFTVEKVKI